MDQLRASLSSEYTIEAPIARGGQGSVFRGTYRGERVALKVFDPGHDPRRLDRELRTLQEVDCPYVVKVVNAEQINIGGAEFPLVVYEYLHGTDLSASVDSNAPRTSVESLTRIGLHIGTAIESLWERRVVHRDVKPANVMSVADRGFVLVDVGLARHLDLATITPIGASPGTPGYQSPEQAQGRRHLSIHSDVLSLGITIYEVAARRHPFNRAQHLVGRREPPPLDSIRSDIPRAMARLVAQMMAYMPAQRPRSIAASFRQLAEPL